MKTTDPLPRASFRQERNRKAARQSRKKKKQQVSDMETRIQQLEAEISQLRSARAPVTRRQIAAVRKQHTDQLQALVRRPDASDAEASAVIGFIERVSSGSLGALTNQQLTILLELLEPFPYMKFLMWGIGCNETFFTPDAQGQPQGLFALLQRELGLTNEQANKIKQMRGAMKEQVNSYMRLLERMKELQDEAKRCTHASLHACLSLTIISLFPLLLLADTSLSTMRISPSCAER
jgi:hypothetical protein